MHLATPRPCPPWFPGAQSPKRKLRFFLDDQRFFDDVHGPLNLNHLERDVVDSPEFQRLFRLGQLGFVDHVFQAANHTRGAHSIATCAVAKALIGLVNANTARVAEERRPHLPPPSSSQVIEGLFETADSQQSLSQGRLQPQQGDPVHQVSFASSVITSLAALLHDISHGPFSHDLEKKTHEVIQPHGDFKLQSHYGPYHKHDNYEHNPSLYIYLLDHTRSVLARVLRTYSPLFLELLELEHETDPSWELGEFVEEISNANTRKAWPALPHELLPNLVFHLLIYEKQSEAQSFERFIRQEFGKPSTISWGLGPKAVRARLHALWYQPYRHDIVGDTVSADLLDYLLRDFRRLGLRRKPDLRLLDYYVLAPLSDLDGERTEADDKGRGCRCAIDLNDYKRGTPRVDIVNDIFRLLDLRFEIHEKAVYHRVVQSSIAMLSRAIHFLPEQDRPRPEAFYGLTSSTPALAGDDAFLANLIAIPALQGESSLAVRLAERRVYRPLMVVPGDRIHTLLHGVGAHSETWNVPADLRLLAALLDSAYYSSFLSFGAWLIEMRLKHALVNDDDLRSYVQRVIDNDKCRPASMRQIARRVLFWALPYKQLYKDPAVWVRVDRRDREFVHDEVRALHTLDRSAFATTSGELASVLGRIETGIADADSKYTSLWKFYVFLSDGLFTTGLLSRFQGQGGCGAKDGDKDHQRCLREAMGLVVECVRAVWSHWHSRRHPSPDSLGRQAPESEFVNLLRFLSPGQAERLIGDFPADAQAVSAVAVDQYVHLAGASGETFAASEKCRDARFKHALNLGKDVEEFIAKLDLREDEAELCMSLAELLKGEDWAAGEITELAEHVRGRDAKVLAGVLESRPQRTGQNFPSLRAMWRNDSAVFGAVNDAP